MFLSTVLLLLSVLGHVRSKAVGNARASAIFSKTVLTVKPNKLGSWT